MLINAGKVSNKGFELALIGSIIKSVKGVNWNASDIKWYYKSTGLPKENQLRLYAKGHLKEAPEEITANVWNWDEQWKIDWFEDGVSKGEMERRVAYDPWAVELYSGPQLPKKHKFVEPTLTDHLFFAKPSANAKEILVKATDRFGNVYQETLQLLPA